MKRKDIRKPLAALLLLSSCGVATAQTTTVTSPCPEVLIQERYDHENNPRYRSEGWDTAVTCEKLQLVLNVEPYIPVQYFNGTYIVEEIPYNPPDPTFYLNGQGTRMNINSDDVFAPSATNIAFPFYFFGIRKNYFRLGDNGMVTFTTNFGSGNRCPYSIPSSSSLPWTPTNGNTPEGSSYFDRMHDAIYGVYEDSHPLPTTVTGNQGIYYGVIDEYPCRKIMASWNEIPLFSSQTNNRQTYQIVCYEGSNIIEVHIKRRGCCSSTNTGANAFIGIQNATGLPQVKGTNVTDPNYMVVDGSPASFAPDGWNPRNHSTSGTVTNTAYRFTPQGTTNKSYGWYMINSDGDSIPLVENGSVSNPNGYYFAMGWDPDHPTLTTAFVTPTETSKYVMWMKFQNANGDWYNLRDTIVIGMDTAKTLELNAIGGGNNSNNQPIFNVCQGQEVTLPLHYTSIQYPSEVQWTVKRRLNGEDQDLQESMYELGPNDTVLFLHPDPQFDTLPHNKIDSIFVMASVNFVSGCSNFDTIWVLISPNYDTTEVYGICRGDDFTWHVDGNKYTESTKQPSVNLHSFIGCDSIVHLDLTVFDVSHTIDKIDDCKPITWLNGQTYTTSNTATAASDTIRLTNLYGCDSIVQLDFSIYPLSARIQSDLEFFDYDHLVAHLSDVSIGNESRKWLFPQDLVQQSADVMYSIPFGLDEADIRLVAYSPFGCIDTAQIVIPFLKETFWLPNAFTPGDPNGNNRFGSVSSKTQQQEMYIYNRQGLLVYHCEGPDCSWDGNDLNGNPCPQGAYAYVVRYTNVYQPHTTQLRKGSVLLIR